MTSQQVTSTWLDTCHDQEDDHVSWLIWGSLNLSDEFHYPPDDGKESSSAKRQNTGRAFDGILGVESQTASWTACVSQSLQLRKCREGWEESSGAKGGKVGVQAVLAGELIHEQGRKCDCANAGHFSSQQSIYNHWMLLPNFSSRSWKGHFRKNRIFPISKNKEIGLENTDSWA